jgi:hypothetical protein
VVAAPCSWLTHLLLLIRRSAPARCSVTLYAFTTANRVGDLAKQLDLPRAKGREELAPVSSAGGNRRWGFPKSKFCDNIIPVSCASASTAASDVRITARRRDCRPRRR